MHPNPKTGIWCSSEHSKTYRIIVIFRVSFRLRIFFKLKLTSRTHWVCRFFTVAYFHLDRQWQKLCLSITRKPDTGGLFAFQTRLRYKHLCCHFVNAARHYDIESIIGFLSGLLSCVTKKTGPCYWYQASYTLQDQLTMSCHFGNQCTIG